MEDSSMQAYRNAMNNTLSKTIAGMIGNSSVNNVNDSTISLSDSIDNTITKAKSTTKKKEEPQDWWSSFTNFIGGIFSSIGEGILQFADDIGDLAIGIGGTVGSWFGADDKWAKDAINYDWQGQAMKALDYGNVFYWMDGKNESALSNDWSAEGARSAVETSRHFTDNEDVQNIVEGVGKGIGSMLPDVALAVLTGGGSAVAKVGGSIAKAGVKQILKNVAIQGALGTARGMANSYQTLARDDADLGSGQAMGYTAINAVIGGARSALSAYIGGKTGGFTNKVGEKIWNKSRDKLGETAFNIVSKGTTIAIDSLGQSAISAVNTALDPVFKQITYDGQALEKAYGSSEAINNTIKQIGNSALISGLTSAITGVGRAVFDSVKENKEQVYKANEEHKEKVVNDLAKEQIKKANEQNREELKNSQFAQENAINTTEANYAQNNKATYSEQIKGLKLDITSDDKATSDTIADITQASAEGDIIKNQINTLAEKINSEGREASTNEQQQLQELTYQLEQINEYSIKRINGYKKGKVSLKNTLTLNTEKDITSNQELGSNIQAKYKLPKLTDDKFVAVKGGDFYGAKAKLNVSNKQVSLTTRDSNSTFLSQDDTIKVIKMADEILNTTSNNVDMQVKLSDLYIDDNTNLNKVKFNFNNDLQGKTELDVLKLTMLDSDTTLDKVYESKVDITHTDTRANGVKATTHNVNVGKTRYYKYSNGLIIKVDSKNNATILDTSALESNKLVEVGITKEANVYLNRNVVIDKLSKANDSNIDSIIEGIVKDAQDFTETLDLGDKKVKQNVATIAFREGGHNQYVDEIKSTCKEIYMLSHQKNKDNTANITADAERLALEGEKLYTLDKQSKAYEIKMRQLESKLNDRMSMLSRDKHNINKNNLLIQRMKRRVMNSKTTSAQPLETMKTSEVYQRLAKELKGGLNGLTVSDDKLLESLNYKDFGCASDEDFQNDFYSIYKAQQDLKSYSIDSEYTLSELQYNLLNAISKANSKSEHDRRVAIKCQLLSAKEDVYAWAQKGKRNQNTFVKMLKQAEGKPQLLIDEFGENSSVFDISIRKPYEDLIAQSDFYSKCKKQTHDFRKYINADGKEKEISDIELSRETNVEVNGRKLTKDQLLQIYAYRMSDECEELALGGIKNGIKSKSGEYAKDFTFNGETEDDTLTNFAEFMQQVEDNLTDSEKQIALKTLKNGYNGICKQHLIEFEEAKGTNLIPNKDKLYMHIKRGDLRVNVSGNDNGKPIATNSNNKLTGITETRTKNVQPILINGLFKDYDEYVNQVAFTTNHENIDMFAKFLNSRTDTQTANSAQHTNTHGVINVMEETQANMAQVMKELADIYYQRPVSDGGLGNIGIVKNAMSIPIVFNLGTWAKMFLDPLRSMQEVGVKSTLKGYFKGLIGVLSPKFRKAHTAMAEEQYLYQQQNKDGLGALRANAIDSTYSKAMDLLGRPLQSFANASYKYVQIPIIEDYVYSQHKNDLDADLWKPGQANNTKAVRDFMNTTGMTILSNADKVNMSQLRSGTAKGKSLTQMIFGVYGGDKQAKWDQINKFITGGTYAKRQNQALQEYLETTHAKDLEKGQKLIEETELKIQSAIEHGRSHATYDRQLEDYQAYYQANLAKSEQIKQQIDYNNKISSTQFRVGKVATLALSMVSSAIIECAINAGNQTLKGNDITKEGDILKFKGGSSLEDVIQNITVDWMPYVSDLINSAKYNSNVSIISTSGISAITSEIRSLYNVLKQPDLDTLSKTISPSITAISYISGIPFDSFKNYVLGVFKACDTTTYYNAQKILKGYTSAYMSGVVKNNIESGNDRDALGAINAQMQVFKTGRPTDKVSSELLRLAKSDNEVNVKDYMKQINDSEGNKVNIGATNIDTFRSIYSMSNKAVEKVINQKEYNKLNDTQKANAIRRVYDAYYEVAKAQITQVAPTNKLAKLLITADSESNVIRALCIASQFKGLDKEQKRIKLKMLYLNENILQMVKQLI